MTKVHGRPDNQEENLDDLLGRGRGDPDLPSGGRWIGVDPPEVTHGDDPIADWLGHPSQQWELGDEMSDHSDSQGWE